MAVNQTAQVEKFCHFAQDFIVKCLIVSFFANLPNAFVTYMLKYEQFPVMSVSSTIAAAVTLVLIGLIFLLYHDFVRYGAHGIRS